MNPLYWWLIGYVFAGILVAGISLGWKGKGDGHIDLFRLLVFIAVWPLLVAVCIIMFVVKRSLNKKV